MKFGVVMEGGASRTIFSAGVTDVLMDEKIYPDYFVGVSAGVAYGASYISKQRGRNEEFTRKYMGSGKYMGAKYLLKPKNHCYYNLPFAFDKIPNELVPFDYKTFADFDGEFMAGVTDIVTGEAKYLPVPADDFKWKVTVASCALPILFRPVEIDGALYLDGGIADSIPYKEAIREGCDKIIVIITRERDYRKTDEGAVKYMKYIYRKYPRVVELMQSRAKRYNEERDEMNRLEKEGKLFIISPRDTTGVKRTEGNWQRLGPLYRQGIEICREMMPQIKEYLEIKN